MILGGDCRCIGGSDLRRVVDHRYGDYGADQIAIILNRFIGIIRIVELYTVFSKIRRQFQTLVIFQPKNKLVMIHDFSTIFQKEVKH